MAQNIRLHGGPMHGQTVAVEDGKHSIKIVKPVMLPPNYTQADIDKADTIPTREGRYSRVGNSTDFEWDGWQ